MKKKLCNLLIGVIMITFFPLQVSAEDICNHNWSDWIVSEEPDCGNDGSQHRYCLTCNEEEKQNIPATGEHDWDLWEETKSATINTTGLNERECWVCGATQTSVIPKLKPYISLSKKTVKISVSKTYKLKTSYAKGDAIKNINPVIQKLQPLQIMVKSKQRKKEQLKYQLP